MWEFPSFVVVNCPEPVSGMIIGVAGLVSFSDAKSVLERAIATTIGTGSFKVANNVSTASADANGIRGSF
jgi:CRISPR/Cas system type I-B associated protein Csh2 (Cas7 group RAMP superfamily)